MQPLSAEFEGAFMYVELAHDVVGTVVVRGARRMYLFANVIQIKS